MTLRFLPLLLVAAAAAAAEPVPVEARSVPVDATAAGVQRVGDLTYRGGLDLASADRRFGGLSALAVSADGRRLTALSDRGRRFVLRLSYDDGGDLRGVEGCEVTPLADLDGRPLRGKKNGDAESMAADDGGAVVVGFERRHRLWRYPATGAPPTPLPTPPGIGDLPKNGGLEALARLADGRLLAIAEGGDDGEAHPAWIGEATGWARLTYAAASGFKPTAAARLPGGDILVVERAFNLLGFFSLRLVRIDRRDIAADARLSGRLVASLAQPLTADNFEGLAVRRGSGGETLLYLVSDNNFRAAQRTLLMMFELAD